MSDIHNLSVMEPPVRLYFSGHEQTSPSHACGPGIWPHYLLHYVLSGAGTFQSEKQSWRLTAGDAFLIIPGVVSAYAASSTDPWEYCWIASTDGMRRIFCPPAASPPLLRYIIPPLLPLLTAKRQKDGFLRYRDQRMPRPAGYPYVP